MDLSFAREMTFLDLGSMAASMSDCEHYGMTYGCNIYCTVLISGDCEHKNDINKDLYKDAILENEG